MSTTQADTTDNNRIAINACWKSIGVYGDRSCAKLVTHTHCRNCEVYTEAASLLRDQFYIGDLTAADSLLSNTAEQAGADAEQQRSIIFRLAKQWFAIPSRYLAEVCAPLAIRAVPKRHSKTLRGVCNVKGRLVPCVSLHRLFMLAEPNDTALPGRMLVLQHSSGVFVVQVDHILEISLVAQSIWQSRALHSGSVLGQISKAAAQYKNLNLTLLDADALLDLMLKELQ